MSKPLQIFSVLSLAVFISSCATTGEVKEAQALKGSLDKFDAIKLTVKARKKHASLKKPIMEALKAQLQQNQKYRMPASKKSKKTLTLELEVIRHEPGDMTKRALNLGGEAHVVTQGKLLDGKNILATFKADGNSRRTSAVSVGGVPVTQLKSLSDDLTSRAVIALSENIVEYLEEKKN